MERRKRKTWKELKDEVLTADEQQAIRKEVDAELRKIELRELRKLAGMSQADVAAQAGFDQGELSRLERREDHRISTLRRYVEALGGELEVVAVLGDHRIRLRSV